MLVGGFLEIAKATGLPLRCLEIGASAGLNTIWDRYHYRLGAVDWGDPQSPVSLAPGWEGPSPPVDVPLCVIERHACDIAPIDLEHPAQRLRLRAYIWADQRERLSRLESAIDLARAHGPRVDRDDAADWVRTKLRETGRVERDRSLPFHHVAIHAARDSDEHPREPGRGRRPCDQRRAFGLVALRAVGFLVSAGAPHDLMARRAPRSPSRRSSSRKQRAMVELVAQARRQSSRLSSPNSARFLPLSRPSQ